jgi:4-amino-4-deoxy-L-arabinose transferase-like glycosyltransferase
MEKSRMRKQFIFLATLTLLVAAILRLWQLHQYPPGPHYDEAVYLLMTRSIAYGGARPFPIIEAYQGREVLYMYLNAPLLYLFGNSIFTLRITSAFLNLITIACSIGLGRAMFRGRRGLIVGLAIGVLMALSFPQIWLARQAFRAVTLPVMQAIALLCLWRGLTIPTRGPVGTPRRASAHNSTRQWFGLPARKWVWLALGGFFGGAAVYTYNSSRLFPLWLGLAGLALLILDKGRRKQRLVQGLVAFGIMGLVVLPMAVYAIEKPGIFLGRLDEVTIDSPTPITLSQSIVLHLKMFFIEGDPYFRYNAVYNGHGRPYFTWLEGILLLVGIGVALWRLLNPTPRPPPHTWRGGEQPLALRERGRGEGLLASERAAYFLALLSPLMVIPSVISVGGLPPSNMRSLGMIPLIFVLVAVGFEALFERSSQLSAVSYQRKNRQNIINRTKEEPVTLPSPNSGRDGFRAGGRGWGVVGPSRALAVLTILTLLIGGVMAAQTYFAWARDPALFYETDADISAAAKWLPAHVDDTTIPYIAARDRGHPTMIIAPIPPVTWLGRDSLFRPPPGKIGLYIFPRSAPPPADWLAWLAPGRITDLPLGPDGRTAFEAFRLTSETPLPPSDPLPAETVTNGLMTLVGTQMPPLAAGQKGQIVMDWQINQPPPFADFTPLLQLEDAQGNVLYRGDAYLIETDRWRPGEVYFQRMAVQVPDGTPPGSYAVKIAWVGKASNTYVPYTHPGGGQAGIWAEIGQMEVQRPAVFPDASALTMSVAQPVEMAPGVRLLGWNPAPDSARPGETLPLTFFWQATHASRPRPSITLEGLLSSEAGDETSLWTGAPVDNLYPSDRWTDGELVTDHERWPIPRDQAAGTYTLALRVGGKTVSLGTVDIHGLPRVFDAPAVGQRVNDRLGDALELYGYTMTASDSGLQIGLVWHALDTVSQDYTVFVHVVDALGNIVAQQDVMPQNGEYPTTLWAAGEYVTDSHTFAKLPDGPLRLRVGLYLQADGTRLPVTDAQGQPAGDYIAIEILNLPN